VQRAKSAECSAFDFKTVTPFHSIFLCILLIYDRDGIAPVEHVEAGNVLALKEKEKKKK